MTITLDRPALMVGARDRTAEALAAAIPAATWRTGATTPVLATVIGVMPEGDAVHVTLDLLDVENGMLAVEVSRGGRTSWETHRATVAHRAAVNLARRLA